MKKPLSPRRPPARRHSAGVITALTLSGYVFGAAGCDAPQQTPPEPMKMPDLTCPHDKWEDDGPEDLFGTSLTARVIATGIPGAGAITEVGDFMPGSPLRDKAPFIVFTTAGQVLESSRLLVASTSNFGAPLARAADPEGSLLSIDPRAEQLVVPPQFAAAGGQATTLNGTVTVYATQSPQFLNSVTEPQAVTKDLPAVSLPLGISLNSGSGRPWIANAPNGARGDGTITVLDPGGFPLAGSPNMIAGGVFAGTVTNRNPSTSHGLTTAALGTAILTKSPDLTGRAVFVAVEADGSVVQIHVAKGTDELAPTGTVSPLSTVDRASAESTTPDVAVRKGVVFNWAPTRNLFITDAQANSVVALDLADDGTLFSVTARRELRSCHLNIPIDLTPAVREVSHANFASNTTLGGGSDLYVLNRGDNSIVRMRIDGTVLSKRIIQAALPDFRVNGIAVSSDAKTIYVTATLPGGQGAVLAVPAFGLAATSIEFFVQATLARQAGSMMQFGTFLFSHDVSPEQGLGPLFNGQSCDRCHSDPFTGGMGPFAGQRVSTIGSPGPNGTFSLLEGTGGPVARDHSIREMGSVCDHPTGAPPHATVVSRRSAMTLRGDGLVDTILLGDAIKVMMLQPVAQRGRPNILPDGRWGKFGWKGHIHSVVEFMGAAFRNEMGLTNPLVPKDQIDACGANRRKNPELDAIALQATTMFLTTLDPPVPAAACLSSPGATLFQTVGCATCHTPTLPGRGLQVRLYSDLLLHDMGPSLNDGITQGLATGSEYRTMPLWRVSERTRFLHDARATTLPDAISAHDGQGAASRTAYQALSAADKQSLLDFLLCI